VYLTSELDVIVVLRLVDSLNGSTDVELLDRVVEVVNGRVSQIVGTEDLLGFLDLVRLVDRGYYMDRSLLPAFWLLTE
jgi:hypothetical protein